MPILTALSHNFKKLFFDAVSAKLITGASISFISLFVPLLRPFIIILILFLIDFGVGIWASVKAGNPFSAARWRDGLNKGICYMLALVTARLLEILLKIDSAEYLLFTVASFIGGAEGKSIFEHLGEITGITGFNQLWKKMFNTVK